MIWQLIVVSCIFLAWSGHTCHQKQGSLWSSTKMFWLITVITLWNPSVMSGGHSSRMTKRMWGHRGVCDQNQKNTMLYQDNFLQRRKLGVSIIILIIAIICWPLFTFMHRCMRSFTIILPVLPPVHSMRVGLSWSDLRDSVPGRVSHVVQTEIGSIPSYRHDKNKVSDVTWSWLTR